MDTSQRQAFEQIIQQFMAREKSNTLEKYRRLNQYVKKGQIVFAGSSLMEHFPIGELKMSLDIPGIIYNRGIGGYTTSELLQVMDICIFDLEPSKLFINIGSNDMAAPGFSIEGLQVNYRQIIKQIRQRLPDCLVTLMAYYPVNETQSIPGIDPAEFFATRNNETIQACNDVVKQLAAKLGCRFVNVNQRLTDPDGRLKSGLTVEGLHMWPDAYVEVLAALKPWLES